MRWARGRAGLDNELTKFRQGLEPVHVFMRIFGMAKAKP